MHFVQLVDFPHTYVDMVNFPCNFSPNTLSVLSLDRWEIYCQGHPGNTYLLTYPMPTLETYLLTDRTK